MGAILGGVAGVLIVVLAANCFVLRRRRRQARLTKECATSEEKAPPRDPEFLGDKLAVDRNNLKSNPQVPHEDNSRLQALVTSPEKDVWALTPGSPQDHKSVPSPQTTLSSTVQGDSLYALGSYSPYIVNGPHKLIAGSRASSVLHGREGTKFLQDTELYHDDARSWMSKRSRTPCDNNDASGAYVVPMTFQSHYEDEEEGEEYQIPLEEQVAFVRSQQ